MKIIHTSLTQHGKLPENLPFDSLAPITGPFAHLHITRKTGLQKEGNRGKAGDVDHVVNFFRRLGNRGQARASLTDGQRASGRNDSACPGFCPDTLRRYAQTGPETGKKRNRLIGCGNRLR